MLTIGVMRRRKMAKKHIQKLPALAGRLATAPLQFGDDWPGVFIRGDDANRYANALERVLGSETPDPRQLAKLRDLLHTLRSCLVRSPRGVARINARQLHVE
jgi:hypothetical protein